MASEREEFLKDTDGNKGADVFNKPVTDIIPPVTEKTEEEKDELRKNRAMRRLEKRFDESEKMNIALSERVKVLSEVGRFQQEVGEDHLKEVEAIFGTDTPEKLKATEILKKALSGMSEKAKSEAIAELEKRQENESETQKEEDKTVDEIEERITDEYGIDMDDESERRGYFSLMFKLSPKDRDGNVKEYADEDAVAEEYLARKERVSNRAKEISSRSMTRSGASEPSQLKNSAEERFLKENGIIF